MVTTKILPIVFGILWITAIVGIVLNFKFHALLRKRYPEKWKELGAPTLVFNNSLKSTLQIFKFLKNKEYVRLNDAEFTKIASIFWYYNIAYLVLFLGIIILFFVRRG